MSSHVVGWVPTDRRGIFQLVTSSTTPEDREGNRVRGLGRERRCVLHRTHRSYALAQDGTATLPEPESVACPGTSRSTTNHSRPRQYLRVPRATARSRETCLLVASTAALVAGAAAVRSRPHQRKPWSLCPRLSTMSCSRFGELIGR